MSGLRAAAVRYAEVVGWCVFPASADKRPLVANGLHDATTDRATISEWWERWPEANLAVRTGRESDLVVLDVDDLDSMHRVEREHGPLPRTASVVTPRGGQHYYFRHPAVVNVPCSVGKLGPGLDVRGDGGYVLVPPSAGANGRRYEPDERAPLAPLPGWLLALTAHEDGHPQAASPNVWTAIVRDGVIAGARNDSLTRLVGHLLRRYVDVDLVAEIAHLVNERGFRPPLEREEVDGIIDSIAEREARRRERAA